MRYAVIKQHEGQHGINLMCRVLGVSRSGYYDWKVRAPSARIRANAELSDRIRGIHEEEKGRPGSPRITRRLHRAGIQVSEKRVAKLMKNMNIRSRSARKLKATTNSNHTLPVAPNRLEQDFSAKEANEKWVSDITYIATDEGWLYLAVLLDLYSRLVVGWSMSERMTSTLVCDALKMALGNRSEPKGVIVHSDRGSQYCSGDYQRLLAANELVCSMSKKGDCYDNAAMESWNHSLKVEAIHGERFTTREQAKAQVFDYIEVYYNRRRLHSTLSYLSPVEFEAKHVA